MMNSYTLAPCTVALLSVGFLYLAPAAAAETIALSFDPTPGAIVPADNLAFELAPPTPTPPPEPAPPDPDQPLPIPAQATEAPIGKGGDLAELPPPPEPIAPPPVVAEAPEVVTLAPSAPPATVALNPDLPAVGATPEASTAAPESIGLELSFALNDIPPLPDLVQNIAQVLQPKAPPSPADAALPEHLAPLFSGGPDSLVAIAVGSAEGTRTPTGETTSAYKGHTDPGNGVWNLGSFSYQHGASSPEEADTRQLARLQKQAMTLFQDAEQRGMSLSLAEQLNAIDLANQSPAAALSRGGYLDRLQEARQMGLTDWEAISWARTRSYLDPDTRQWNAPGLGNTVERITADQERRMAAIAKAMDAWDTLPQSTNTASVDAAADRLLAMDLP